MKKRVQPYGSSGTKDADPPPPDIQYDERSHVQGETPAGDTLKRRIGKAALRDHVNRIRARRTSKP